MNKSSFQTKPNRIIICLPIFGKSFRERGWKKEDTLIYQIKNVKAEAPWNLASTLIHGMTEGVRAELDLEETCGLTVGFVAICKVVTKPHAGKFQVTCVLLPVCCSAEVFPVLLLTSWADSGPRIPLHVTLLKTDGGGKAGSSTSLTCGSLFSHL